jgi:YVTN family beta-propeller protein
MPKLREFIEHIKYSYLCNVPAYIANYSDNTISVIDTATNIVISTITVGSNPFGITTISS